MSSKDLHLTLAAIDAATGCQQCAKPLGHSPSDDFCGEACQAVWSRRRADIQPAMCYVDEIRYVDETHAWPAMCYGNETRYVDETHVWVSPEYWNRYPAATAADAQFAEMVWRLREMRRKLHRAAPCLHEFHRGGRGQR